MLLNLPPVLYAHEAATSLAYLIAFLHGIDWLQVLLIWWDWLVLLPIIDQLEHISAVIINLGKVKAAWVWYHLTIIFLE